MPARRSEPGREPFRHAHWSVLAALYAGLIFALSDTPGDTLSAVGLPAWVFNLAHAPLYAGLSALVLLAFAGRLSAVRDSVWPTLWTFGAVATYALSDEFHQRFVPGRTATVWDLALDLSGAVVAIAALQALSRRGAGRRRGHAPQAAGYARADLLVAISVFLLAVLLYLPSLGNGFTNWDDDDYVYKNPRVQALSWENLRGWWTEPLHGNYAPLTLASHALDHGIWGLDPFGHHLGNVILHGLAGALLAVLILALRAPPLCAAIAAGLFIIHPAQVESVAWIAERKSLLAMVFMLLSLIVYVRGTREAPASRKALLGCLLFYVAALLSKLSVVVLPGVLFLYDLGFRREGVLVYIREKIPFAAAAIFFALLNYRYQAELNVVTREVLGGGLSFHLATIASLFGRYTRIILFPTELSILYDPPVATARIAPWSAAGYAFLLAGAAGFLRAWLRHRRSLWWMGLFWLGFLTVAQIVPFWIRMADRYLHVPLAGLAVGVGLGGGHLLLRLRSAARRAIAATALLCVFFAFTSLSWERQKIWQSSITLWEATLQRPPVHFRSHLTYARALEESGAVERAIPHYERALAADPDWILTLNWFGNASAEVGDLGRAQSLFRRGMAQTAERKEDRVRAAMGLGMVLSELGRSAEAMEAYQAALVIDPAHAPAHIALARSLRRLGRVEAARRRLDRAWALDPDNLEAEITRAGLEADEGRLGEALARLDALVAAGDPPPEALYERARVAAALGNFPAARADVETALSVTSPGLQRRHLLVAREVLDRGKIPPLYATHQASPSSAR
ncbi:MAG: VanZ family protein [Deltaproteobacteria bacterium]|nr:VanZ family protein [Deltaproteobacteria bacterium]